MRDKVRVVHTVIIADHEKGGAIGQVAAAMGHFLQFFLEL